MQIDPEARKVIGDPIKVPGAVPLDLVAGDGVWVTDSGGALRSEPGARGGVTRVDLGTRIHVFRITSDGELVRLQDIADPDLPPFGAIGLAAL